MTRANAGACPATRIAAIGANVEARSQLTRRFHVMDERRTALLEETRTFWQARSPRSLTLEDARQAVENMTGFLTTLQQWAAEASEAQTTDKAEAA